MAERSVVYAISTDTSSVGKTVAMSKRMMIWRFGEDGESHSVALKLSMLTSKKTIFEDDVQILNTHEMSTTFSHTWESRSHTFRIDIDELSKTRPVEFFIDNVPFGSLPHVTDV